MNKSVNIAVTRFPEDAQLR